MTAQTTTGYRSAATTTGDRSAATTTGYWSAASTTGYGSAATTTGCRSAATTTGNESAASTTGYGSAATTTGYGSAATTTGDRSAATTTGCRSAATTTGNKSAATTTGCRSAAMSAQGAAQTEGAGSVAVGRLVRLTGNGMDAVVLPAPGFQAYIVSIDDGWPEWQWISMADDGTVSANGSLLLPYDGRGYSLRFVGNRYVAGCRKFTYDEAIKHWSDPDHEAPRSAALLLAEVERHHARVTS